MSVVLESTKRVVDQSEHVSIDEERIEDIAKQLASGEKRHWLDTAPFDISSLNEMERLHFILLLDSISFSYWDDPKWNVEHAGKQIDGAYALIAALGNAINKGIPLTNPAYLAHLSENDLLKILEGENAIPLFYERLDILRRVGRIIETDFKGSLINFILSGKSADELLRKILETFPFFQDGSEYKGEKVYFYKRAQLLIADIFQKVEKTRSAIGNIDDLTACADYKLPQMLRKWGALRYSRELSARIHSQKEIPSGDPMEIEIRANTIWAVEKIKNVMKQNDASIRAVDVNDSIWLASQNKTPNDEPYHRTRTTKY